MSNILAIDDWAGNVITDYAPMIDAGVKVAINRLGQGDQYNNSGEAGGTGDTLYRKHIDDAHKAGLLCATYWAISPELSWKDQVAWVQKNWKPEYDDIDLFFVDDELVNGVSHTKIFDTVGNFVGAFGGAYGCDPGMYTAKSFWETNMRDANGQMPLWQSDIEFWLAQYPYKNLQNLAQTWQQLKSWYPTIWTPAISSPRSGKTMKPVSIWQWAGGPILPGIKGAIDINFIDSAWLEKHTKTSSQPPVIVTPPVEEEIVIEFTVQTATLRVHTEANTTSATIGTFAKGDIVVMLDKKVYGLGNIWIKTSINGQEGYCAFEYLNTLYLK